LCSGKILSAKTRKVVNRASNAFRIAAQSLANSKTALGAFYRRIRSRSGAPIAITATAHKLARIFYRLWTTGEDFVALYLVCSICYRSSILSKQINIISEEILAMIDDRVQFRC
jgi:hypothetical protein